MLFGKLIEEIFWYRWQVKLPALVKQLAGVSKVPTHLTIYPPARDAVSPQGLACCHNSVSWQ